MSETLGAIGTLKIEEKIPQYSDIIKDVFITTPLKSVVVIDNEYPTYSELFENKGNVPNRPRADEANEVIKYFRLKKFICDIENSTDDEIVKRLTNSDLLILDYHLQGTSNDESINIIRQLSENNKNFNTIIVHTDMENLQEVWYHIATSCTNLQTKLNALITGLDPNEDHKSSFENFKDENSDIQITRDELTPIIASIANDESPINPIQSKFVKAKQNKEIFAAYELSSFLEQYNFKSHNKCLFRKGECSTEPYWMLLDNCFIAVCSKKTIQKNDYNFINELQKALINWNPSPIKIITTAIQNLIENSDIFSSDTKLNRESMNLAISAFLFEYIKGKELNLDSFNYPINILIQKLGRIFSDFIGNDQKLNKISSETIISMLQSQEIDLKPKIIEAAVRTNYLSAVSGAPNNDNITQDAYFYLNEFMNSCEFNGKHITNGTILYDESKVEYFVVSHASCDLVPRDEEKSRNLINITLMKANYCKVKNLCNKLKTAERGENVFIQHKGEKLCLQLIDSEKKQPRLKVGYLTNNGTITDLKVEIIFTTQKDKHETKNLTIIGQLNEAFADRFLHYTITHTGRVGVDFYNLP